MLVLPKNIRKIFSVELTDNCNFVCKFCPHSIYGVKGESGNIFDRQKGFMSEELFDIVLDNADKYARIFLLGFFGEQLLHPEFNGFIDKIPIVRPYKVTLNTNWSLVTENHLSSLRKMDAVKISLDSIISETYDELCPGGKVLNMDGSVSEYRCETIIEKIKEWVKIKDRPSTEIIFVTSSLNEGQRNDFVKYWRPYLRRSDIIAVKSVISYGGVMKDDYMTENTCNLYGGGKINIAWNGDSSPCNLDVNMGLKGGNLLESRDVEKMTSSEEWKSVLKSIKNGNGICSNCFDGNNRYNRKLYEGLI